tara:strand:- start:287 stop:463 length:177 start_codon:yes stop_codon:yes gene_type:complete
MSLPPTIAAEMALTRQNVAFSAVKAAAETQQQVAAILEDAARSAPVSSTRGANVNTSA